MTRTQNARRELQQTSRNALDRRAGFDRQRVRVKAVAVCPLLQECPMKAIITVSIVLASINVVLRLSATAPAMILLDVHPIASPIQVLFHYIHEIRCLDLLSICLENYVAPSSVL